MPTAKHFDADQFVQALRISTSELVGNNAVASSSVSTPIVPNLGNGKALVMAVSRIDMQLGWVEFMTAALNRFVIGQLGSRAGNIIVDGLGWQDPSTIAIQEVYSECVAVDGSYAHRQGFEFVWPIPFLYASNNLFQNITNAQPAGDALGVNSAIWYYLKKVDAGELIGIIAGGGTAA